MRTEYKRDVHNNYLVLEGDQVVDTASYPVRMLLANAIPSLLKCRLQGMDGKLLFYYEITSRQSLDSMYEGKQFGFADLQMIFGGFVQLIEKMAEYLLNPDQLLIAPEYIYLDVEKKQMQFCYLPGYEKPVREQFQALTEYVLPKLNHEDSRAVILGYGIYRRALEDVFALEHIKEEVYRAQSPGIQGSSSDTGIVSGMGSIEARMEHLDESVKRPKMDPGETFPEVGDLFSSEESPKEQTEPKAKKLPQHMLQIGVCVLAAGLLLVMALAGYMGYLPMPGVEVLMGGILVLAGIGTLLGFLLKKRKKTEPEIPQKEDPQPQIQWAEEREPEVTAFADSENRGMEASAKPEPNPSPASSFKIPPEDNGETIVLCAETVTGPASLVSREPGEFATIYLQEELTIIGKLEQAADAVIPLPTISRLHAKIRRKGEDYILTDLNSKNGTAVNGRMLKGDEEYLLQEEDEVDFAQARFVFLK